tara:strand:- start:3305 stop:3685 length:381 start_codon:yes stop_codon:yes gene_type:complete
MATENLNMNIEKEEQSSQDNTAETQPQEGVRLTGEMLSKINVSVNMKFLSDIRNIIEVATQRGTWRANELTTIGSLVDTLDNAFRELANKTKESPPSGEVPQERTGSPLKSSVSASASSATNSTTL